MGSSLPTQAKNNALIADVVPVESVATESGYPVRHHKGPHGLSAKGNTAAKIVCEVS